MTPDRWNKLRALYDVALDHAPNLRLSALSSQAGDDPELINEVLQMIEQHNAAGSFLESSPAKDLRDQLFQGGPLFQPDDRVAQRFKIIRLIGTGGMGEVYEAEDIDLGQRIALKTVRIDRLRDAKAHQRLRREALLARKVTHPNICRIYDVLRHQIGETEVAVLSMELLEGQTLAQILKVKGQLSPAEAEPIIRQILAALGAAHQSGIVHRDLKPSNVILVDSRAVVTDFGLAIAGPDSFGKLEPSTTLTLPGQLLGTPEYMAPEQIRNQTVTARSDIYALGMVMYEMLTGQRPSPGANGIEEVLNRVLEAPPSPRTVNPKLSRRWESVILRCLEREPERRFASAEAVLAGIDSGAMPWQVPKLSRRVATSSIVGLASIAAGAMGYSVWSTTNTLPINPIIVLTPVAGLQTQFASTGLLLFRQLEQSSHLRLWNLSNYPETAKSLRLGNLQPHELSADQWRNVGHRVKAAFIVHTSISQVGGEYVFNCKVERLGVDTPRPVRQWDSPFRFSSPDRALDAIGDLANWVRATVGETQEEISTRNQPAGLLTTPSWEALRLFEQSEAIRDDRTAEAISLLREAVRLDSEFAIAWMRLGDLQVMTRDWSQGIASWRKAVDLADAGHLSQREADRIRTMYAMEIGDMQAAEAAAIRWSKDFPNELRPLWETFQSRLEQGRIADAEKIIPSMAAMPDSSRSSNLAETIISMWIGDTTRMRKATNRLREAGSLYFAQRFFSCSFAMRDEFPQALVEALPLLKMTKPDEVSRGYVYLAALGAAAGDLEEAKQWLKDGLGHDQAKGLLVNEPIKSLGLAYLAWLQKRNDEVRVHAGIALQKGDPITMIPQCVALLHRSGNSDLAFQAQNRWKSPVDSPRFRRSQAWMKGEELLATGKYVAGLESIRAASNLYSRTMPPEPLLYALMRAGQQPVAKELARNLMLQPASLWYLPETLAVGTIYFCRQCAGSNLKGRKHDQKQ